MKRAVLEISPQLIVNLCQQTKPRTYRVIAHPLPDDAHVVGAMVRGNGNLGIVLESDSFEDVPLEEENPWPTLTPPVFSTG